MGKKSYKKWLAVRSADRPASLYRTKIESISDPESVKTSACSPLVGGNGLAPASPTHPASHPHFNHGWKNVSHTGCTSRYAASQHRLSAIPCHSRHSPVVENFGLNFSWQSIYIQTHLHVRLPYIYSLSLLLLHKFVHLLR